jgi:hypothetical protein
VIANSFTYKKLIRDPSGSRAMQTSGLIFFLVAHEEKNQLTQACSNRTPGGGEKIGVVIWPSRFNEQNQQTNEKLQQISAINSP